ncbi:hypothetical protein ACLOJK_005352 [Asimina triloba]
MGCYEYRQKGFTYNPCFETSGKSPNLVQFEKACFGLAPNPGRLRRNKMGNPGLKSMKLESRVVEERGWGDKEGKRKGRKERPDKEVIISECSDQPLRPTQQPQSRRHKSGRIRRIRRVTPMMPPVGSQISPSRKSHCHVIPGALASLMLDLNRQSSTQMEFLATIKIRHL